MWRLFLLLIFVHWTFVHFISNSGWHMIILYEFSVLYIIFVLISKWLSLKNIFHLIIDCCKYWTFTLPHRNQFLLPILVLIGQINPCRHRRLISATSSKHYRKLHTSKFGKVLQLLIHQPYCLNPLIVINS
jgi:hypothetical protein